MNTKLIPAETAIALGMIPQPPLACIEHCVLWWKEWCSKPHKQYLREMDDYYAQYCEDPQARLVRVETDRGLVVRAIPLTEI